MKTNKKELFIYLILLGLIYFINKYKCDFIRFGFVEEIKDNYYLINKIIYKVELFSDEKLSIGDILKFEQPFLEYENTNKLKNNILFYGYNYQKLFSFKLKNDLYQYVNSFKEPCKIYLLKYLYNEIDYTNNEQFLGYGFSFIYFYKFIFRKNRALALLFLIIYSFVFPLNLKILLIILELFISFLFKGLNKIAILIYLIYLINPYLLINNSILLYLLINLYYQLEFNLNFNSYLIIVESFIFKEINLISLYLFKYLIYYQILIYLFSLIVLVIPNLEIIYLFLVKIYLSIIKIELNIRGQYSLISILLYYLIIKLFKLKNPNLKYIILIILLISPLNHPFMKVTYIDVGQGDAILIKMALNQGNILIDTGSKYNYYKLKKYLFSQGIYQLDYLIITHNDSDHNGNLDSLLTDFKITKIIDSSQDIKINKLSLKNLKLSHYDNDNDNSLVYYTNIDNYEFLFTGDISKLAEKELIALYGPLSIDFLKVSHHGSKTASSAYFISNILPKYAIISTSGMYNHPSEETLKTLNNYQIDVISTKEVGDIEIYLTKFLDFIHYKNSIIILDNLEYN